MCDFSCKLCVSESSETGPIYITVGTESTFLDQAKDFPWEVKGYRRSFFQEMKYM